MTTEENKAPLGNLLNFMSFADEPFDEEVVEMDCNDGCEQIAELAERVASGEKLESILPKYAEHLQQVGCCKEEFDALVEVIRVEKYSS